MGLVAGILALKGHFFFFFKTEENNAHRLTSIASHTEQKLGKILL